ncbi:MAG: hypothetical protein ACK4UN_21400, partial [Limisphaerales bacterium]
RSAQRELSARMAGAIAADDPTLVRSLLEAGVDPNGEVPVYAAGSNRMGESRMRFLTFSAQRGSAHAARALIEAGADVHARDALWRVSSLDVAERIGDEETLQVFREAARSRVNITP